MPSGGCNLSFVQWFTENHFFVDLMLQARRPWVHALGVEPSDDVAPNNYVPGWRSDGYPKTVSGSQVVTYVVGANQYPDGTYRVYFDGVGTVRCAQNGSGAPKPQSTATLAGSTDTLIAFPVNGDGASQNRLEITILESSISEPVKNIRVIAPGHDVVIVRDKTHANYNPFNPDFLDDLQKYSVIRFMDWLRTNESIETVWEGRTSPEFYSWGVERSTSRPFFTPGLTSGQYARTHPGCPYEATILLGKLTGKDIWVNIPWNASDDLIASIGTLYRDTFPATQKIYLEHGNEPWNTSFLQGTWYKNNYVTELQTRGLPAATSAYQGRQMLQAYDSRNAWDIWRDIFGTTEFSSRIVRVLNSQSTSPDWTADIMHDNGFGRGGVGDVNPGFLQNPDAIAVAPYIGSQLIRQWSDERRLPPPDGAGETEAEAITWLTANRDRDYMLSTLSTEIAEKVSTNVAQHIVNAKKAFNNEQLDVIGYEGGQHYVLAPNYLQADSTFRDEVFKTYRHADMYQIYRDYFDAWEGVNPGALFCPYNEVGEYGDSGGWGTKEHRYQVNAQVHRDRAITDWLGGVVPNPGAVVPSGAADTVYDESNVASVDLTVRTNVSPYGDSNPPPDSGGGTTGGPPTPERDQLFLGVE